MPIKKPTVTSIVQAYNILVRHIDDDARAANTVRAYGGTIRSAKGALVEGIAKNVIEIAWSNISSQPRRLSFEKQTIRVPIHQSYIEHIQDADVQAYLRKNINNYVYQFKTDIHISIDGNLVAGVECKAYTENAMLKRIAVDAMFLKHAYPNAHNILFQLESQLGGDYGDIDKSIHYGSYSTHTILSYFEDINLHIITLLEGERKVNKPIHKKDFYKKLEKKSVQNATRVFEKLLEDYV
jgi:hypothetical protein